MVGCNAAILGLIAARVNFIFLCRYAHFLLAPILGDKHCLDKTFCPFFRSALFNKVFAQTVKPTNGMEAACSIERFLGLSDEADKISSNDCLQLLGDVKINQSRFRPHKHQPNP